MFAGFRPYAEALPKLFPWAHLRLDEDAIDVGDEDEWMEETGIWDGEEHAYVGTTESFAEWRTTRYPADEMRPYAESAGELAHWCVLLELNDLGRALLVVERYLSSR